MDRAAGEVYILVKQNKTNTFPVRTEQASSVKFLSLWLYFKFSASIARLYRRNARKLPQKFCKLFGQTTRERFLLNANMFPFEYLSRTQISKSVRERSILAAPYSKIRTAQIENQSECSFSPWTSSATSRLRKHRLKGVMSHCFRIFSKAKWCLRISRIPKIMI